MSERKEKEKTRVPLHQQNVLTEHTRDGFKRSWVFEGDVERYKLAGWELVDDPDIQTHDGQIHLESRFGSAVTRVLNKGHTSDTNRRIALLMEIPADIYEEDYRHEQQQIDATESSIDETGEIAKKNYYGSVEFSRGKLI